MFPSTHKRTRPSSGIAWSALLSEAHHLANVQSRLPKRIGADCRVLHPRDSRDSRRASQPVVRAHGALRCAGRRRIGMKSRRPCTRSPASADGRSRVLRSPPGARHSGRGGEGAAARRRTTGPIRRGGLPFGPTTAPPLAACRPIVQIHGLAIGEAGPWPRARTACGTQRVKKSRRR